MPARLRILCLLLLSSVPATAAAPPDIILITLDTTRADRMGFLGSTRGLTPNLDALSKESVVFLRAYSQAPLTTASHATIFTGTYPQYHGVNDFGVALRADIPSLPGLLQEHGYRTAAFVGSIILDPKSGFAPGFDRGFDVYDAGYRIRRGTEDRHLTMERRADEVVARATAWINRTTNASASKSPRRPFFLWVHLYDPHDPYEPPAPYAKRYAAQPYDGEIAYTDAAVGRLLATLRARGLFEGSLIAVMADHGEALGQHGENTHGIFLYDETIHVPLLIKPPAGKTRGAGSRVRERASLVDVAPTILKAAGIVVPGSVQGHALPGVMGKASAAAAADDAPAYAETDYPRRAFGWSPLRAIRAGKYLFVLAPERELYDQSKDPGAAQNLAARSTAVSDTLAAGLQEFLSHTSNRTSETKTALTPEQTANLGALGYVAGTTPAGGDSTSSDPTAGAIDPKKKIEVVNLLHDALLDVEAGRYDDAIPRLERVLAGDPQMFIANMQLGTAWVRKKQPRNAATWFQKAVALQPENAMAQYELGLALFATGDWPTAAEHFEVAVARSPKWPDAQYSLASVYARIDRVPEAKERLLIALGLNPELFAANLLYGRILTLQRQEAEAIPYLEKAVALQPDSAEAHAFLGDAFAAAGREADAARERSEAKRLAQPR